MVTLKKVDGNNIWDILKLRGNDYQKEFVASNDVSIIEAYIAEWCGMRTIIQILNLSNSRGLKKARANAFTMSLKKWIESTNKRNFYEKECVNAVLLGFC